VTARGDLGRAGGGSVLGPERRARVLGREVEQLLGAEVEVFEADGALECQLRCAHDGAVGQRGEEREEGAQGCLNRRCRVAAVCRVPCAVCRVPCAVVFRLRHISFVLATLVAREHHQFRVGNISCA